MENIAEKIKNLKVEDLEFYKKLISFFDTIGINSEDLATLVKLIKTFPEFITKINAILDDQKIINEKYNAIIHPEKKEERVGYSVFDDLNKDVERLNIHGK